MVSNGLNRKAQNAKPCGCTHIVRLRTHMKCAACINEEMLYLSDWRACVLIAVETTDKELEGPRPPTRLRASAATAVRARARADLELVTHLRIGASGRCARKPWIQAACFAASAPELGLAGWLPRLLGTVLCEFPLGECGACACYEARLFSRRGSSFERDARPLRRASAVHRSRNLVWTLLTRLRGARLLEFRGASSPPRRRDARPALSRISFGLRMEYHSADCASNRLCARAFYYARAVTFVSHSLSLHHCKLLASGCGTLARAAHTRRRGP